ncbi:hypothetical protein FOFC_05113 [Fusarium oxysporum]|nr:hypothetical protein FOFC_05113 [Fusarium oxysporum]
MPSATKAHHEPLTTTRKTESRPCCSLDNRPVTEAFPVRGLERKRGLRCYSCRSVQPTERVARRPSEHSAGGHTTHERKTNKALLMKIVEEDSRGADGFVYLQISSIKKTICMLIRERISGIPLSHTRPRLVFSFLGPARP